MNSKCCNAPLEVSTADEGTSCWICTACNKPSDPIPHELVAEELAGLVTDIIFNRKAGWSEKLENCIKDSFSCQLKARTEEIINEIPEPVKCLARGEHCSCADSASSLEDIKQELRNKYLNN